ncbi:Alanine--tRNA ligase [Novosphingobium resinovorum]|uniref:Alanine--tRNA ligase n=1 Tax=Novosphingobium resinovorum TaxID=158500 RepID=A0A031K5Q8_9SPHN|nr:MULTISPECIES: alanyl-tRNA editing protein [Novosphingobium]EZP83932.1 Alanine--tRNA ligase [Novosphingobium resinovorum]
MSRLLYLEDAAHWRCEARLTAVIETAEGVAIELDTSPFYPRGGGQPSDTGTMVGPGGRMTVRQVSRTAEGTVVHEGQLLAGSLIVGETVMATIDRDARLRNARLHTAGEVICAAAAELGRRWPVTAASHIPGQSRVAFQTDLGVKEVPAFIASLKSGFAAIVARDEPVETMNDVAPDEARRLCALDAAVIDGKHGPLRLVSPVRGFYRPCMGAHLQRTGEIGEIVFRKTRLRDGELSISYALGEGTDSS